MSERLSLVGQKFNHLTVVKEGGVKKYYNKKTNRYDAKSMWWCKCDCGNEDLVLVMGANLKNGRTKSCGCLRKNAITNTAKNNKKYNTYDMSGEYGIGYTSNTNRPFYFDLEDYDLIKGHCWMEHKISGTNYSALETFIDKKQVRFHYLLGKKGWDHINRNTFDNRSSNLRKCNGRENNINHSIRKNNTSGVTGVYYIKQCDKWQARINCEGGKTKSLGYFKDFEEAVRARLMAEKEHYGEWSPQKHLYKKYGIED